MNHTTPLCRSAVCTLLLALVATSVAVADLGPPVHLQVTETEERRYAVQWRVPKVLPARAAPTPMLPETCRPATEASVTEQPAAWIIAADWGCDATLAGQVVGMDYPNPDLSLTTVIRVDLLSGDRFAKVLNQGEESWQLPEGTAPPDILEGVRRAVLAGASHVATSWIHLLFVLALALVGGGERVIRLVTAFSLGQLAGIVAANLVGGIPSAIGEIGLLAGVVVIARQAIEPEDDRRRLPAPTALAGLAHGLGLATALGNALGDESSNLVPGAIAILGMDAVHLVAGLVLATVFASIACAESICHHPGRMNLRATG